LEEEEDDMVQRSGKECGSSNEETAAIYGSHFVVMLPHVPIFWDPGGRTTMMMTTTSFSLFTFAGVMDPTLSILGWKHDLRFSGTSPPVDLPYPSYLWIGSEW